MRSSHLIAVLPLHQHWRLRRYLAKHLRRNPLLRPEYSNVHLDPPCSLDCLQQIRTDSTIADHQNPRTAPEPASLTSPLTPTVPAHSSNTALRNNRDRSRR